jgi:SAM-dependent methyltransferase
VVNNSILNGYESESAALIDRFEAISSAEVFAPVQHLLPRAPSRIIDIGAGTGRDAAWFASLGHKVVAVEPVQAFRLAGIERHSSPQIEWVNDTLPTLTRILARNETFDLIVLSAVWQHLENFERKEVFPKVRALAPVGGLVIISIRNGPGADSRPVFPASPADAVSWAGTHGFRCVFEHSAQSIQTENRIAGVTWTWLGLQAV